MGSLHPPIKKDPDIYVAENVLCLKIKILFLYIINSIYNSIYNSLFYTNLFIIKFKLKILDKNEKLTILYKN